VGHTDDSETSDNGEGNDDPNRCATACVKLTKSLGFDIVVAMRMLSYDALVFPKTAESSGRCRCSVVRRASAAQDSRGGRGIDG
jgi:hypothetical protein